MFRNSRFRYAFLLLGLAILFSAAPGRAQLGNSGSIEGVVRDSSGGVVANATVEIVNPVSRFERQTTTATDGSFRIANVPFNPYHLAAKAEGFQTYSQDVDVRSTVPVSLPISLKVGPASTSVTVEAHGGDLVENDPSFHTDVDQAITDHLPLESASSAVSSLVTLVTAGIAADSNGLTHGMGDDRRPRDIKCSVVQWTAELPRPAIVLACPPEEVFAPLRLFFKLSWRKDTDVPVNVQALLVHPKIETKMHWTHRGDYQVLLQAERKNGRSEREWVHFNDLIAVYIKD